MLGNTGKFLGPVVAGLSDVSFVVTMVILYEYFSGKDTGIINGSKRINRDHRRPQERMASVSSNTSIPGGVRR